MPLVGVICPLDDNFHYFDDCRATHNDPNAFSCNAPKFLLNELSQNDHNRRDANISTTVLTGCARVYALKKTRPWFINPTQGWNMARGTWAHAMFEQGQYEDYYMNEQRLSKGLDILGQTVYITGKPDEVNLRDGILIDYKTKHTVPTSVPFDHEAQFNVYVWLLQGGTVVTKGPWHNQQIDCTIVRGGMHYVSWQTKTPWRRIKVDIWDTESVEYWIRERVEPIVRWQESGLLPTCNRLVAYGKCDCQQLEESHYHFWKQEGII